MSLRSVIQRSSLRSPIVAVLTAASLVPPVPSPARADTPLPSRNGQAISAETVDVLGSAYYTSLRQKYGRNFTEELQKEAQKQVLEQIITATVLQQEAERRGIVATESEIDTAVASNDYFKTNGATDWA